MHFKICRTVIIFKGNFHFIPQYGCILKMIFLASAIHLSFDHYKSVTLIKM